MPGVRPTETSKKAGDGDGFQNGPGNGAFEKAFLVHVFERGVRPLEREARLLETRSLVGSAGASIVGEAVQSLDRSRADSVIGSGKLREVAEAVRAFGAELVVFGCELSGGQRRNVEGACGVRVVDRTELILDIFARRAVAFEGKAQVKLAQLSYRLSRLAGGEEGLSRLGGGIGTRGPGETKLETDRRRIRREIARLRAVVKHQGLRRAEQRRRRSGQGVYSVGIVGYTNAGKTTLLSGLTARYGKNRVPPGSDRLFDTLDRTARRVIFAGRTFVFTDTVGFIRDLPHHLVDAFRATLEEAIDADALVLVVDAHSDGWREELDTVRDVLHRVLRVRAPVVTLFNERPRPGETDAAPRTDERADRVVFGSALSAQTLDELLRAVDDLVGRRVTVRLDLPEAAEGVLAFASRVGRIGGVQDSDGEPWVDVRLDERTAKEDARILEPFVAQGGEPKAQARESRRLRGE